MAYSQRGSGSAVVPVTSAAAEAVTSRAAEERTINVLMMKTDNCVGIITGLSSSNNTSHQLEPLQQSPRDTVHLRPIV